MPAFDRHSRQLTRSIQRTTADADRKSTRLNSSHQIISYAVFCLKKKKIADQGRQRSIVAAGDGPQRRPRGDGGDTAAGAPARQADRDGAATRLAAADARQRPGPV